MSEIQTETVDAQAESIFSFDLFNKVDEEEIDELDAEVEATVVESETKALPSRPSGLSVLESAPRGDSKLSTWLFGIAMNMVRNYLRKMIEQDLYDLPVLSYQELTPEVNIQPLARVEL